MKIKAVARLASEAELGGEAASSIRLLSDFLHRVTRGIVR